MKKYMLLVVIIAGVFLSALSVHATAAPKVFVCKYVGTPNVNERLQTGQNPIDVSENSIKDFQGVGSFFNDAQGRSYVLAVDVGQTPPTADQCPQPENKPVPTPTNTLQGTVTTVTPPPANLPANK